MSHVNPRTTAALAMRCVCLSLLGLAAVGLPGCRSKAKPPPGSGAATQPATQAATSGPPVLALETEYLDVGAMEPNSSTEKSVAIWNTGGSELAVRSITSTCNCLQASADRKDLLPGEGTHLKLKVESRERRGRVMEKVGILTNDPAGTKTLTVAFEVRPDLATVPQKLYMGIAKPDQALKKQVQVVSSMDAETKLLYTIASTDGLVGRVVDPVVSRAKPGLLEVEFKAPANPGTRRGTLTITAVPSGSSTLSLPVVLCVSGCVAVRPEALDFGSFPRGQASQRTIEVTILPGTQLKAVTAKPDVLILSISHSDASVPSISAEVKPDLPPGPFAGELQLELTGQEQANLVVPFAGELMPR